MAAVINKRDVALQAASPRTATVNLGSTVNVNGNVTGTLDGSAVATVVSAALSATANYFTTSASNPTGGSDGDAHYNSATNVMWFKISGTWTQGGTVNANAITVGTLAAARIASGSITSDKINVSSLSAVSANLGTVTAGSITGSSGISITGQATFNGAYDSGFGSSAINANMSLSSNYGVIGRGSGSGYPGVYGVNTSTGGVGVQGTGGSGGYGVRAVNSSGTALIVEGAMTTTSSALVSNLRSATTLLADNSTKWSGLSYGSITTGSATATFVATNKPGSNTSNSWFHFNDSGGIGWVMPVWRVS